MPTLTDTHDEIAPDKQLGITFELQHLETYAHNTSEGWIIYELNVLRGNKSVVRTNGTIHSNDVQSLVHFLSVPKFVHDRMDYEPTEPDFSLHLQRNGDDMHLTCFVDYGTSLHKISSASALGIRFPVSSQSLKRWAHELEQQRLALTHGIDFSDYTTKSLS